MAIKHRTRGENAGAADGVSSSSKTTHANAAEVSKPHPHGSRAWTSFLAIPPVRWGITLLTDPQYFWTLATLLFIAEVALNALIIKRVAYTEIDWKAYMQEVSGYLNGETDYRKLRGDTGPLVYPAGFVYIYSALYYVTDHGSNLRMGQWVFMGLYLATFWVVAGIYTRVAKDGDIQGKRSSKSKKQTKETKQKQEASLRSTWSLPPYVLLLVSASRRLHSIYVLRMFNDPVAMFFMYASTLMMIRRRWTLSSIFFSLALSVKMNILLFFPAFGFLLWEALGALGTMVQLAIIVLLQILFSLPFTLHHADSYLSRAFEFSRVFMYKWTVNWKMVSESAFLSKPFATVLLACHVIVLLAFLNYQWSRGLEHGVITAFLRGWASTEEAKLQRHQRVAHGWAERVVTMLWTSNFLGIVFSRSLHYQFYSWYAMTVPYLLWRASFFKGSLRTAATNYFSMIVGVAARLVIWGLIEWSWNVFPATAVSSAVLFVCHLVLLAGLWLGC
ncbi:dolichyl-P-Man:Man(5)GlcNAc(2)-PP-dolichol alpha-1,3-mannosyltransferase [Actinomortierella ambigua]|nr:dolichyl-P-Man:Man(5)GlcNAc(2)-PP-dolichol alpha-1,3-mannosyltransferase [Actinomortierella ambigua]